MVGNAHPTKIALLQLVQDVIRESQNYSKSGLKLAPVRLVKDHTTECSTIQVQPRQLFDANLMVQQIDRVLVDKIKKNK